MIVSSAGTGSSAGSAGEDRRIREVVGRQERQQLLDVGERVLLVVAEVVRHAGAVVVRAAAAEVLHLDVLAGHRLDHVRAGDEHVAGAVDHHDEVGERGGVHRAARRRAHDQRDLRDHPGAAHVAHEDLAVEAERDHALLDPRAAPVVDPDHRAADLGGDVHHLDDLLAVHLAERAAEHRGVLAEHGDRPAVDRAGAGDDAVAERAPLLHPEVGGAVPGEGVELDERAGVEQHLQSLAGGVAALGVLALGRLRVGLQGRVAPVEVGQLARGGVEIGLGVLL